MTEQELKKLNRRELLEMLITQGKKVERLQKKLNEAESKLRERQIAIEKSGSIAEAALVINNVFTDAQRAADQYLENVKLYISTLEQRLMAIGIENPDIAVIMREIEQRQGEQ